MAPACACQRAPPAAAQRLHARLHAPPPPGNTQPQRAYFDRRTLLPKAYADNIAEAIGEIRRVGNNINQLAYHANARRKTTPRDLQEARRLLTALEADVACLLTPPPLPGAPTAA